MLKKAEGHGTRLFPQAFDDKYLNFIKCDPLRKAVLDEIREQADDTQPIKSLPFSLYKLYAQTGNRVKYEAEHRLHRKFLTDCTVLSLFYDEPRYIERLEDAVWAVCDEYSWALPAHFDTLSIPQSVPFIDGGGNVQASPPRHNEVIDLVSAATALSLAEAVYIHDKKLSPLVVYRAKEQIVNRVFKPFLSFGEMQHWEAADNNWSAVCAGCIGGAALYLIEDTCLLAPVIHRVLSSLDCFLMGFGDDGFCFEGTMYWMYGMSHYIYFAQLLYEKTNGGIDLFANEKLRKVAMYPQHSAFSCGINWPYSDSGGFSDWMPGHLCLLKSHIPEIHILNEGLNIRKTLRDILWFNEEKLSGAPESYKVFYNSANCYIRRFVQNNRTVCFAAMGGANNWSHGHNDMGSFVLHINGETLLTDPGSETYTKQSFSERRYELFTTGSQGHSVPVVNGRYQKSGDCAAVVKQLELSDNSDKISFDISSAYDGVEALVRAFDFSPADGVILRIADNFRFAKQPEAVTERFITRAAVELTGDGTVSVTGENGAVTIAYNPQQVTPHFSKREFTTSNGPDSVTLIDFSVSELSKEIHVEFAFQYIDKKLFAAI
jgi:hypothetical protein